MGEAASRPSNRLPKVIGIIGIGQNGSLGYEISLRFNEQAVMHLVPLDSEPVHVLGIERLLLNNRDDDDGEAHTRGFIADNIDESPVDVQYAHVDRIARECDIAFLCFGKGIGAAKGNFHDRLPAQARQAMFNSNISGANMLAEQFAKAGNDSQDIVIWTNPIDLITYFFNKRYQEVRDGLHQAGSRRRVVREGRIVGADHLDRFRAETNLKRLVEEHYQPGVVKRVHAMMVGPHNRSMTLVPALTVVQFNDRRKKSLTELGIPSQDIEQVLHQTRMEGDQLIRDHGSSSDNTAASAVDLIKAMYTKDRRVELALPFSVDGRQIFVGQPADIGPDLGASVDHILSQYLRSDPAFMAAAKGLLREIAYLEKRQSELQSYFRKKGVSTSVADLPKFWNELVVPCRSDQSSGPRRLVDSQERLDDQGYCLRFFNFTEPFDEIVEVRDPILIDGGSVGYIENLVVEDRNVLAVTNSAGVQVIDPARRERKVFRFADPVLKEKGIVPNGCCHFQGSMVASVRDAGLYRSKDGELVALAMPAGLDDFQGHVLAYGERLFFSYRRFIAEAEIEGDTVVIRHRYAIPREHIHRQVITGFTVSETEKDEGLERAVYITMRPSSSIAKVGPGMCYRFAQGDAQGEKVYDEKEMEGIDDYTPSRRPGSPGTAYVYDRPSLLIALRDQLICRDIDGRGSVDTPVLVDGRIGPGHVLRHRCHTSSVTGGAVILAREQIDRVGRRHRRPRDLFVRNRIYRMVQDQGKGDLRLDPIPEIEAVFRFGEDINAISMYSEFR